MGKVTPMAEYRWLPGISECNSGCCRMKTVLCSLFGTVVDLCARTCMHDATQPPATRVMFSNLVCAMTSGLLRHCVPLLIALTGSELWVFVCIYHTLMQMQPEATWYSPTEN